MECRGEGMSCWVQSVRVARQMWRHESGLLVAGAGGVVDAAVVGDDQWSHQFPLQVLRPLRLV